VHIADETLQVTYQLAVSVCLCLARAELLLAQGGNGLRLRGIFVPASYGAVGVGGGGESVCLPLPSVLVIGHWSLVIGHWSLVIGADFRLLASLTPCLLAAATSGGVDGNM